MKITPSMRRWARRHILINDLDHIVVRVEDGAPIELLSEKECPNCRIVFGDCTCKITQETALVDLIRLGLARRVPQE